MTTRAIEIAPRFEPLMMLDEPIMNYDMSDALPLLNTERIERCFKDLTHNLDVGLRLLKNIDVIFARP